MDNANNNASAGHKLGQIIGDWYEEYVALPVLQKIADDLGLFLDGRFKKRSCRGEKILWNDADNNTVDYDFVMELNGTDREKGIPVAFFETFWRRGSRHSKDKARDDSGKLLPMKQTFPTARVLGIIAAGDFTAPARELISSRLIDLFYIEKQHIISAWSKHEVKIDYPDISPEELKNNILQKVVQTINKKPSIKSDVAKTLFEIIQPVTIKSYELRLIGKLGAIPQKYSLYIQNKTRSIDFQSYSDVDIFLNQQEPNISDFEVIQLYAYQVDFSDGDVFVRDNLTWDELKSLHLNMKTLIDFLIKRIEPNNFFQA